MTSDERRETTSSTNLFANYLLDIFPTMTSTAASDPTILSSKRAVYVGGLDKEVTPQLLRAALIPFGNIKSLDIVSTRRR